jgi:putative phosphoesterase
MIGILSDTHNNEANLLRALDVFRAAGVGTLFHCGDLTQPETARLLDGFRVIFTFGNGDLAEGEIINQLKYFRADNYAAHTFTGEIEGVMLAATHGHERSRLDPLVQSGRYAYVFRGHSHRAEDTRYPNGTRLINPGALGGLKPEPRQCALLDLVSGELRRVEV